MVLVTHNSAKYTLACLRALARLECLPRRMVVTDNGSASGEVERLLEGWTEIASSSGLPSPVLRRSDEALDAPAVLLALPDNRGFAAGNNAALRSLLADPDCHAFWLLNNDTEPAPQALEALCARLDQTPAVGLCGSTLVLGRDPQRLQCAAGGAFSPWLAATRHLAEGANPAHLPEREATESRLDYIIGASMLIRREVLERVGLLPEEHFLYCEDADFSLAARRAGFGLGWAPESVVIHHQGGSSGVRPRDGVAQPQRSRLMDYLALRNRFHLVRKYHPAVLPIALLTLPFILANRLRRGQAGRYGLMLRAAFDALVGRMGKPKDTV